MAKFNKMLEFIGVQKDEPDYADDSFFDDDEDSGDIAPSPYQSRRERGRAPAPAPARRTAVDANSIFEQEETPELRRRRNRLTAVPGGANKTMIIYSPASYNDSQNLVLQLKQNKQVIIKLDTLEKEVAQRILDFMSGAAFAIEAQITKISKGIYLFTSQDTFIQTAEGEDTANEAPNEREGFFTLEDSFDRRR